MQSIVQCSSRVNSLMKKIDMLQSKKLLFFSYFTYPLNIASVSMSGFALRLMRMDMLSFF